MANRYALATVLLAALSIPAAAQQTAPSDTSKKSGTTVTESAGAIADTAAKAPANPNAASPTTAAPSTVAPSPGATVTTPSTTAPSSPSSSPGIAPSTAPSTAPSAGATVTAPAPTTEGAANAPSGVTAGAANTAAAGAAGQVQPTSGAIKVDVKVEESLANTVKISADSAFALARASNTAGEISSAELEMTDKRLVYQVKMVKGAGASTVYVDAMTGEVVKDKKFGGLKAAAENQEESQKLLEAKEKKNEETKDAAPKAP